MLPIAHVRQRLPEILTFHRPLHSFLRDIALLSTRSGRTLVRSIKCDNDVLVLREFLVYEGCILGLASSLDDIMIWKDDETETSDCRSMRLSPFRLISGTMSEPRWHSPTITLTVTTCFRKLIRSRKIRFYR